MMSSIEACRNAGGAHQVANGDGQKPKARQLRAMMGEVFLYGIRKGLHCNPAADAMRSYPSQGGCAGCPNIAARGW